MIKGVFGLHDHSVDPRSGRPGPHESWVGEAVAIWNGWAMAVIMAAGALVSFLRWRDMAGALSFSSAAVLLALITLLRSRSLNRKREALRRARKAYEEMLGRAAR